MSYKEDLLELPPNIVQTTTDYTMFRRLPGNREVRPALVHELIRSFTDKPQLITARPILLNESYQVVDGQHRLEALKRCDKAVPYMVVPQLTVADARLLNALQRSWSLTDFVRSFAETEGGKFMELVDLMDEYKLPPRVLIIYASGKHGNYVSMQRFRMGYYDPRPYEDIVEDLDRLREFEPYQKSWNEQAFAIAVVKLLRHEKYDHQRMLRKLRAHGVLQHHSASREYLRDLESVYNTNTPAENFVRFL